MNALRRGTLHVSLLTAISSPVFTSYGAMTQACRLETAHGALLSDPGVRIAR